MKAEPHEPEEKLHPNPDDIAHHTKKPKAGTANPQSVNSLALYRKRRNIKRELSDPKIPKTPPRIAEWNYKKRCAEILVDGKMLVTTTVRPSQPALKGESRMIASFEGGLEAEVAAAWFWMATPPSPKASTKTPLFRPIKLKRGEKKTAKKTAPRFWKGPHRWMGIAIASNGAIARLPQKLFGSGLAGSLEFWCVCVRGVWWLGRSDLRL